MAWYSGLVNVFMYVVNAVLSLITTLFVDALSAVYNFFIDTSFTPSVLFPGIGTGSIYVDPGTGQNVIVAPPGFSGAWFAPYSSGTPHIVTAIYNMNQDILEFIAIPMFVGLILVEVFAIFFNLLEGELPKWKSFFPKFIVSMILAVTSYYIAGAVLAVAYLPFYALYTNFNFSDPSAALRNANFWTWASASGTGNLINPGFSGLFAGNAAVLLILTTTLLMVLFMLWFASTMRTVLMIFMVIILPIASALLITPWTDRLGKKIWRLFVELAFLPFFMALPLWIFNQMYYTYDAWGNPASMSSQSITTAFIFNVIFIVAALGSPFLFLEGISQLQGMGFPSAGQAVQQGTMMGIGIAGIAGSMVASGMFQFGRSFAGGLRGGLGGGGHLPSNMAGPAVPAGNLGTGGGGFGLPPSAPGIGASPPGGPGAGSGSAGGSFFPPGITPSVSGGSGGGSGGADSSVSGYVSSSPLSSSAESTGMSDMLGGHARELHSQYAREARKHFNDVDEGIAGPLLGGIHYGTHMGGGILGHAAGYGLGRAFRKGIGSIWGQKHMENGLIKNGMKAHMTDLSLGKGRLSGLRLRWHKFGADAAIENRMRNMRKDTDRQLDAIYGDASLVQADKDIQAPLVVHKDGNAEFLTPLNLSNISDPKKKLDAVRKENERFAKEFGFGDVYNPDGSINLDSKLFKGPIDDKGRPSDSGIQYGHVLNISKGQDAKTYNDAIHAIAYHAELASLRKSGSGMAPAEHNVLLRAGDIHASFSKVHNADQKLWKNPGHPKAFNHERADNYIKAINSDNMLNTFGHYHRKFGKEQDYQRSAVEFHKVVSDRINENRLFKKKYMSNAEYNDAMSFLGTV